MRKILLFLVTILLLNATVCYAQNACVYIAGFTRDANGRQYAAYWKSGQLTKLTNGTNRDEARTIAVSGYDVHVGGFKMGGVNRVAAYWKNGQQIQLNLIGDYSGIASQVYAIKTVGNDVYMFVTQPSRRSTGEPNNFYYYKNGSRQTILLSDYQTVNYASTNSESYFVSRNGDIYILCPGLIDGKVTYWKNGNRITGSTDLSYLYDVRLKSIFVSDNGDVYIAANKILGINGASRATCWKNGNEIQLAYEKGNTYAESMYVEGSTVYVAGNECKTTSHFSAVYWKNGYKTVLHNYDTDGYDATTMSIASVYGAVYVAGSHNQSLYWVNGKVAKLDQASSGEVFSMTVVNGGGCFNNTVGSVGSQSGGNANQANQQQQYNNAVSQGQNSIKSGDYAGAIQGYANAAATATTKSEKQLATGGVIISGLTGIADAWQKSAEEKRKREELERLERERLKKEKEQAEARAKEEFTKELENNWKTANSYAALKTAEGYKQAISLMLAYATADKLNGMALNTIGTWYRELNDGVNEMKWYKKAAYYYNNADAYFNMGIMYRDGKGVKANQFAAMLDFQNGCKKGSNSACIELKSTREIMKKEIEDSLNNKSTAFKANGVAETYRDEKNYTEAEKYYKKAILANNNYYWAAQDLAKMYFDTSQLKNYDSAAKWYGIAISLIEIDTARQKDIGTKNWFDNSYTDMLFNYAYANRKINNGKLAIEIYLKAVRDGYTGAYTQIGVTYELGLGGIEKDWKLAAEYYEKDADKNSAKAMYYLGQLYEKDGPNLDASARLSKKWYKKACEKDAKYCKK